MFRTDRELRKTFLKSPEGQVFVTGSFGLMLWLAIIIALWRIGSPWWNELLIMGFTQLSVGRVAGIAYASTAGIHRLLVTVLAIYLDMLTVFLIYPLLIFSYKHLVATPLFQRRMKPIFESAEKGLHRVARFQIVGVFFFVWIPFWMTGVVVGSVLGYLMGLKTWVIMFTVGAGTTAAIVCWVYAQEAFFGWLSAVDPWLPRAVALCVILMLVVARFVVIYRNRRKTEALDTGTKDVK